MPKKIGLVLLATAFINVMGLSALAQKTRPNNMLHAMAKRTGGRLVLKHSPSRRTIYSGIEDLAGHSDIIVVGRTLGHRSRLRADGNFLTEDFLVRVQEVVKGDVHAGRSILVSLPGGSYRYPDGTHVTMMPVNYNETEDGRIYVFFLRKKGAFYKGHQPTAEAQGQFKLNGDTVQPADLIETDPVVAKYRGMKTSAFLAEIHRAIPRKKR
jgi:hypothetical protein